MKKGITFPTTLSLKPLKATFVKCVLSFLLMFGMKAAWAQATFSSNGSGNWTTSGSWTRTAGTDADNIPDADDIVNVIGGNNITVNTGSQACASLNVGSLTGAGNSTSTVTFSSGTILTVGGTATIGNAGGTNRRGTIVMTAGGTLICQALAIGNSSGTNAFTPGTGTVQLTASNTLPVSANTTAFSIFNNLVISGGTTTLAQDVTINSNLNINSATSLDLSIYSCNRASTGGTLTVAGTLLLGETSGGQTGSNFPLSFTTLTMTGGNVNYDNLTGGQTIYATPVYNVLTVSNTSGTQTAGGNLTTTTLNTTASGTLSMSTFTLALTNISNAGAISTLNTSATPIPTGKTWGGTVIYAGAGQTVSQGNYSALTLSGSGTKTFGGLIAASGLLTITTGIIANPGALNTHTANTLTLGTLGANTGTFGSTSSAATRQSNTFFTAGTAGYITVAASTCTAPTITLGTIAAVCQTSSTFSIPYTATTGSPNLYSLSGTGITTVTNATLPATPIGASFTTTGTPPSNSFLLTVSNTTTGCISANINSSVTVTATAPAAAAGPDATICPVASTLVANAASPGTGAWTIPSGPNTSTAQFSSVSNAAATFTPTVGGAYTLRWTITNGACASTFDETIYTVNAAPQVSVFSGNSVCTGGIGQLTVTTSAGTGPFTVIYTAGPVTEPGVVSGTPFNVTPNPGSTTNYTLTSITDNNGCVRTSTFTDNAATITINTNGTWIGTTTNWFTPSNWCGGAIPTAATDVIIPAGGVQPTINTTGAVCNNITNAGTLTFSGAGYLTVSGNYTNNGTVTAGTGTTIEFNGTTQSITGASSFRNLTVNSTTSLSLNAATTVAGVLSIPAGKTLIVNNIVLTQSGSGSISGTLRNTGAAGDINPTALVFNSGGTYDHNRDGGDIPTATWNAASNCNITGITTTIPTIATFTPTGGFGNFTWNSPSQTAVALSIGGSLNTVNGNFTLTSTGSGSIALGNSGTGNLAIAGNYSQTGGGLILSITIGRTVTVNGNFSLSGGTLDMSSSTTGGNTTSITVLGDFSHTGGTLTETGSVTTTNIIFAKTGTQLYTSGGTLGGSVDFTVNSGAILQMGTGAAPATISNGSAGFFTLSGGATLVVTSAAGITSSGATGNIQVSGARTFSTTANYNYTDNATQVTGNGLPATVNNLIINNTGGGTGVTLSAGVNVSGTLTLTAGNFTVGNNTLTLSGPYIAGTVNNLSTTSGSSVVYSFTGTGPFTLPNFTAVNNLTFNSSAQTYNLNSSPTVSGTLTLTNGIVSIGSNTLTLNGAVARTAGFLRGSNTSNLTLAAVTGSLFFDQTGTNNILKNFTLNTGATATLGNALNITGYDGTSSEGILTVNGTATLTTGGFLTIKSNTNGTARIAAGRTTGGYVSGDVTVERFIPANSSKAWRLLASNTNGQTIKQAWQENQTGFNSNTNPGFGTMIPGSGASVAAVQALGFDTLSLGISLFKYIPATDLLDLVPNTNTTQLNSEQGYFIFIRGDRRANLFGVSLPSTSTTLRSKGTLFMGTQTAVSVPAGQFALVRNPYASRLDMRQITRTGGLVDAYQVWDPKLTGSFGAGAFQTFTKSGTDYIVSPGGGSYGANGTTQNFIESGAAFYVQSTGSTGSVQVLEASKASGSQVVFRPSTPLAGSSRLLFNLYAVNIGSTDVVDGGIVDFDDTYSDAVDVMDVRKSTNFNENFSIFRNNTELVVERRSAVTSNDSVFFKMYQLKQISYRIDIQTTGLDPQVTAILQDKFTGANTVLNPGSMNAYTFAVNSTAGSFATDRFRVVFTLGGNIFTGTGNWTDNARWSLGAPPASADAFTIAASANATLNTDFTVAGTMTMENSSTLSVDPGKTLSVGATGTANLAAQSVTLKSDNSGTASLGQVLGTINGATNVTVERYVPNNGFRSWRLLSVPTHGSGQTIREAWQEGKSNPLPLQNNLANFGTQITGTGSPTIAQTAGFDDVAATASLLRWGGAAWNAVTNTNTAIDNFPAYFLFIRGERTKGVSGASTNSSATTLRTNGTVFTGDQLNTIGANAFALVPNLYPSAISFTGLTRTGGVSNIFYIWDSKKQSGNSLGVYQTFSGINSFNCLVSGGSYTLGQPNTTIESGQAFFVQSTAAGTLTLKETAKISGTNGSLGFRPAAIPAKIDSRLYNSSNEMLDANTVVFDAAYDKAVDADDAPKLGNPGANFAVETGSKLLAIEGRQPITNNDAIQFRLWNLQQQHYKFEFAASNIDASLVSAILEDNYLNTNAPVDLSRTITVNFTVDGNAGSAAANRFRLVFKKAVQAPIIVAAPAYSVSPNPVENGVVNLQFKNQPAGKYSVKVVNTMGQVLLGKIIVHASGTTVHSVKLPSGLNKGVYELQVLSPDNKASIQRLVVDTKN